MFVKKPTSADFAEHFNDTAAALSQWFTKSVTGFDLRHEYQPNVITKLLEQHYSGGGALTTHIGCGGGKSLCFILACLHALLSGEAKRIVVVAPTVALTRQLEEEFLKLFKQWQERCRMNLKKNLLVINVSSDREAREEGADDDDIAEYKQLSSQFIKDGAARETTTNRDRLLELLTDNSPAIYFVCKKSFVENFMDLVKDNEISIDITVVDEYHNMISQHVADRYKSRLKDWRGISKSCWYFSATKRAGKFMSWYDDYFGQETCDIKSSQLVKWGYLVPDLRVYMISAGSVRGISDALKEYFKGKGVKKADRFFKEAAVILSVLKQLVTMKVTPQALVFGSKVSILKEMLECSEFVAEMKSIVPHCTLNGVFGDTSTEQRQEIFNAIRTAAVDQPSLTLNHSVIKEGIDVTKFNAGVIMRGMAEGALQQALGRIQRKADNKDCAYLFVYIDTDDNDELKQKMSEIAMHLHYALGDLDVVIYDLVEELVGDEKDEDQHFFNFDTVKYPLLKSSVNIAEFMKDRLAEAKQEQYNAEELQKYRKEGGKSIMRRLRENNVQPLAA